MKLAALPRPRRLGPRAALLASSSARRIQQFSSEAAAAAPPLYVGAFSTRYSATPEFKKDVGEFVVLQQLDTDGNLAEGVR